ncbi:MAG: hypothetical protein Q8Q02_14050 [Nocardioides sp.]|nr:hypothetical protein [Nocardioides sp.]
MRRLLLPLFTGLALVAGPVVLAAPATAETLVVQDAKKDVRVMDMETGSVTKDPAVRDHDIVRTRVAHRRHALVVRVKHRSLTGPKAMQGTSVRIVTRDEEFSADWFRIKGMGTFVELTDQNGETVECKVTATNRPKKALRTLRVPRTCLGEPTWVRVNPMSLTVRKNDYRVDFGMGGGMRSSDRLTRRVRVG